MYKLNINDNFHNRKPVSINSVWALLYENSCNNWEENIFKIPKLRIYVKFKKRFEVEPYILSFMNHKIRSYLAQFRSGILPLQIEVGRWANKNVEERLCLVCNEGLVEDELHFIFHYNYYNSKRCDFSVHITKSVPNFMDLTEDAKLHIFMFKENVKEFNNYMCNIYEMRQKKIFK